LEHHEPNCISIIAYCISNLFQIIAKRRNRKLQVSALVYEENKKMFSKETVEYIKTW